METARELAEEWLKKNRGLDYDRSLNNLERLIIDIKKEQDRDTRHACAEAVLQYTTSNKAHMVCMNVKAV